LDGTRVLVSNGTQDPLVTAAESERLVKLFRDSGATADLVWQAAGHQLAPDDVTAARRWLERAYTY
jgi:phospholipase/carboxylesterase